MLAGAAASIYGLAARARNAAYDKSILTVRKLEGPVLSIGSISAGGAGKTPFVIFLGQNLIRRGVKFDVLSRGYGRSNTRAICVDPGGDVKSFGDEPLLIARKLGSPVYVAPKRLDAGRLAERAHGSRLHLLDDGFQHRQLHRDLDLVLITRRDLQDRLLPSGRLREPVSALRRATALVAIGDDIDAESVRHFRKPTWRATRGLEIDDVPSRPFIFCGIARPNQFLAQLKTKGIMPAGQKFFRDHHRYSVADVDDLLKQLQQSGADGFITTEKDVVNLGLMRSRLGPLAAAKVAVKLDDAEGLMDLILRTISCRA